MRTSFTRRISFSATSVCILGSAFKQVVMLSMVDGLVHTSNTDKICPTPLFLLRVAGYVTLLGSTSLSRKPASISFTCFLSVSRNLRSDFDQKLSSAIIGKPNSKGGDGTCSSQSLWDFPCFRCWWSYEAEEWSAKRRSPGIWNFWWKMSTKADPFPLMHWSKPGSWG